MRNEVTYEWDIENIDKDGDILDHHHADRVNDLVGYEGELVLVRNTGNDDHGIVDRQWAYAKHDNEYRWILPEYFSNSLGEATGYRVPKRFHDELKRSHLNKH